MANDGPGDAGGGIVVSDYFQIARPLQEGGGRNVKLGCNSSSERFQLQFKWEMSANENRSFRSPLNSAEDERWIVDSCPGGKAMRKALICIALLVFAVAPAVT